MDIEWKTVSLEEVAVLRNGAGVKQEFFRQHGVPLIRVSDFTKDSIDVSDCRYVDHEHARKWKSHLISKDDVIVATVGSWPPNWSSVVGKVVRAPLEAAGSIQNQNTCCILPKVELLDNRFLFYRLKLEDFIWHASNMAGGSANQARLSVKKLAEFIFSIPPLQKQKAIAQILGSLDDKIELSRQMNTTLEGMAQALFKSWFVDFDPVIDNALAADNPIPEAFAARAETRRKALADGTANRDVAKLFPAAFEFTEEMGWIPKGWETKKIANFANIKHGFAFKGEYFSADKTKDILLTPGNFRIGGGFKGGKFKYYKGPVDEEYVLHHQDLIVTMTDLSKAGDTLGYPAFIPISNGIRYLHNQRIGRVLLKNTGVGKFFLYQIFRSNAYRDEILGGVTGSTVKHTSPSKIIAFTFPYSGGILEGKIENVLKEFEYSISKKNEKNLILSNLRDILLPKLISGELRIPEAEKLTEEALA